MIVAALTPTRVATFWANVALPDNQSACWHWTGDRSRRGGYGRFSVDGLDFAAHRVALSIKLARAPAPMLRRSSRTEAVRLGSLPLSARPPRDRRRAWVRYLHLPTQSPTF